MTRIAAAFALVLALAVLSLAIAGKYLREPASQTPAANRQVDLGSGALFYRSIGHAPAGFLGKPRRASRRRDDSYTLEIAALASKDKAKKMLTNLATKGIRAFYTPVQTRDGRILYRVRTGLFKSQKAAAAMARKLKVSKNIKTRATKLQ